MLILNQDKTQITNFDNIETIEIDEYNGRYYIRCTFNDGSSILGGYKTEERAMEILKEIANKYSEYLKIEGGPAILQGQIDIQPNIFNIPKVFEMPKE